MTSIYEVLRRPIITEKTTRLAAKYHQYVFEVALHSTRAQVKEAVETLFENVEVAQVNVLVTAPKRTRSLRNRQVRTRRPAYKKAFVTLSKGTIPIFEGVKG
ncbi:MAG: 50S ribosomal protein L23 [Anaerolineales bacterium]|jgi:large subunit ribosomal protein L23